MLFHQLVAETLGEEVMEVCKRICSIIWGKNWAERGGPGYAFKLQICMH